MTIKPIGNRVLLKSVEIEEKTKGGIILPGTATQEKPNTGEIVAVGTGKELEGLKVGDKVVYEKYGLTEIKDKDEKFLIADVEKILRVLEEKQLVIMN